MDPTYEEIQLYRIRARSDDGRWSGRLLQHVVDGSEVHFTHAAHAELSDQPVVSTVLPVRGVCHGDEIIADRVA